MKNTGTEQSFKFKPFYEFYTYKVMLKEFFKKIDFDEIKLYRKHLNKKYVSSPEKVDKNHLDNFFGKKIRHMLLTNDYPALANLVRLFLKSGVFIQSYFCRTMETVFLKTVSLSQS